MDSLSILSKSRENKSISENVPYGSKQNIDYFQAAYNLTRLSIPSIFGSYLRRGVELVNYWFIGRLSDPDYIAGAGLGYSTASILCITISIGMAGGIETLSSQAFGSK